MVSKKAIIFLVYLIVHISIKFVPNIHVERTMYQIPFLGLSFHFNETGKFSYIF